MGFWEGIQQAAGYGDTGKREPVHEIFNETIYKEVYGEDWQGKDQVKFTYGNMGYPTLEEAKQALTNQNKQKYKEYASVDFSNLRNDPNWRKTLLNHAIYTAGLGNLTNDDIMNMQAKFATYQIEDIIDVEKEAQFGDWYEIKGGTGLLDDPATEIDESKMARGARGRAQDIYKIAGDTREQALADADVELESVLADLQKSAYKGSPPISTGVGLRGQREGSKLLKKAFETGYDAYGLSREKADTAYERAGISHQGSLGAYASSLEALETGYETTLQSELFKMFPEIFEVPGK